MQFDRSKVLVDRKGKEVQEEGKGVLLSTIIVNVLDYVNPEHKLAGEDKFQRFKLQNKLYLDPEGEVGAETVVSLTSKEVSLILRVLGEAPNISPYVYGQIKLALGEEE